ncbi:MAG: hypothetical protein JG770_1793, partial [Mahella sp.]|nr:hypothetical protein [Mahella sp.]
SFTAVARYICQAYSGRRIYIFAGAEFATLRIAVIKIFIKNALSHYEKEHLYDFILLIRR